jgi:antitoxin ParD1/3/4
MSKNTSILLGEYFEKFIDKQVKSGRFASASEVIRTALRLFEQEETQKKVLINELKAGEKSGFVPQVDRKLNLKKLHAKHL